MKPRKKSPGVVTVTKYLAQKNNFLCIHILSSIRTNPHQLKECF